MQTGFVGNTHLIEGGPEKIVAIVALLQKNSVTVKKGDPDLYVRSYKSFGIEDARELRERAALRPVGARRIFIVASPDISREAQNALLKTIEEPPGNALFFFIVHSPETLLATFRSRAQLLVLDSAAATGIVDEKKFLAAAPAKRIDMLKPLLEKGDDERRDLGAILSFLASLEKSFDTKVDEGALSSIYRARKYATDKGALLKPLLEQLALHVPKV